KTIRDFQNHLKGEGHYLALLKKGNGEESETQTSRIRPAKGRSVSYEKLPEDLRNFLQLVHRPFDAGRFDIRKDRVYYMPEGLPDLTGIRFLRSRSEERRVGKECREWWARWRESERKEKQR